MVMNVLKCATVGAIAAMLFAVHASPVRAELIGTSKNVTYAWSGICNDAAPPSGCGTGEARAVIELQNYTPGSQVQLSNLVSFTYVSSKYNDGVSAIHGFATVGGAFPAVAFGSPFATDFTLLFWDDDAHTSVSMFETFSFFNAFWCFNSCGHDVGNGSTFVQVSNAQVSEPDSLALFLLGLIGLGLAVRTETQPRASLALRP